MDKLVSIIVPIWNVEPYIRRCLDSIVSQTYPHLEVILVDDGSPDNCGEICEIYARKDERIKVIHQANQGVSVARQVGLDAATGDYIIHVDPDDFVEIDMIESLVKKAELSDADMVTCNFYRNDMEDKCDYSTAQDLIRKMLHYEITICLWNVLIRRSFIQLHQLSFYPLGLSFSEDFLFVIRCLKEEPVMAHLDKPFYHYIQRGSGLSGRSDQNLFCLIEYIKQLSLFLDATQFDDFYYLKRYSYIYAYEGRYWKHMKGMFPDIHDRLISGGGKFMYRYSIDSQLARCMKYPPCLVWFEAKMHKYLMIFLHKGFSIFKK